MKIFIYGMIFYFLFVFSSCGNVDKPSSSHVFNGIFKTETGIKFELKEDSTTFIQFNDSIHYIKAYGLFIAMMKILNM